MPEGIPIMVSLIITVFVLLSGWHAYRSAKKSGVWSNKVFFGILLAVLAFTALISVPIYFIPPATADAHFGLIITCWVAAIAIAVSVITIYANRWWKSVLLRRSGADQPLKAVVLALLLFSLSGSAQTGNTTAPGQSNPGSKTNTQKLQALERACKAGVFTPDECQQKRAALNESAPNNGRPDAAAMPPAQREARRAEMQSNDPNFSPQNSEGNLYNDPAGNFSLTIPQGWDAAIKKGCYGPKKSCPANSAGVNMKRGTSWAFIAPYSVTTRQPTDMVSEVAEDYQSAYRDFTRVQNEPSKVNGMDAAVGIFSGTDGDGVPISFVVVGIVAPNGRYYVAASSVPRNEGESVHAELHSMLTSLRFSGQ